MNALWRASYLIQTKNIFISLTSREKNWNRFAILELNLSLTNQLNILQRRIGLWLKLSSLLICYRFTIFFLYIYISYWYLISKHFLKYSLIDSKTTIDVFTLSSWVILGLICLISDRLQKLLTNQTFGKFTKF